MTSNVNTHVANFAARFCYELDSGRNFISSPLSVENVLGLVALGSRNESRAEIFKALDIANEDDLRSVFTSITQNLKKPFMETLTSKLNPFSHDYTLKIANKIYVKQGKALRPDLKKDAEKVFNASLEQIDFRKNSDAANSINNWVASQTNNVIKNIVSADMLDESTGIVLVNAIYFHGFWEIPFKANDSFTGQFQVSSTKKVDVEMMKLEGVSFNYKHCPELQAKILQMFYVGGQACLVIVLPDELEGMDGVLKCLTSGYDLMTDIKSLQKTDLRMGIKTIFDPEKADTHMLTDEPLYVSEAVQKAYIAVDEMGTEAAAAAIMVRIALCGRLWTGPQFIANHSFLFLLMTHEIPIFSGIFHGNEHSH